jgi:hypothetical protein
MARELTPIEKVIRDFQLEEILYNQQVAEVGVKDRLLDGLWNSIAVMRVVTFCEYVSNNQHPGRGIRARAFHGHQRDRNWLNGGSPPDKRSESQIRNGAGFNWRHRGGSCSCCEDDSARMEADGNLGFPGRRALPVRPRSFAGNPALSRLPERPSHNQ